MTDKTRILVVDDSESIRDLLNTLLTGEGCEVRVARTAENGLALLKEFRPAVAMVDIVLPGMSGLELLSRIKHESRDTEVLVMTGHGSEEYALQAIRLGAYDYLEKPFEKIEEVWFTVQRAIERRALIQKGRALLEDSDRTRILVVDDSESTRDLLKTLLEGEGCEVRLASTAEDGLASLKEFVPAVAMVDIVLPGMSGLDMLSRLKERAKDTEVVVITGHASAGTALQAIRQGAYDYLEKPFDKIHNVWITVQRAIEKRNLVMKNRVLLEKQEKRNRELSSTVSLTDPAAGDTDAGSFSEFLEYFVELVAQRFEVDRVSLMLLDEETRGLRIAAGRGITGIDPGKVRIEPGDGIAGSVAETGETYFASKTAASPAGQAGASPDLATTCGPEPIAMSLAIKSGERILGVVNVGRRRDGKRFGRADEAHLAPLAEQLAAAIEGSTRSVKLRQAYASLKSTQEQLAFSERIKAVGQMAAGVAHDFNNALSVILGRAQFALTNLAGDFFDRPKVRSDLETIIKAASQGTETVRRVQGYTRNRNDAPEAAVDLNAVVRDAVEITRPRWKEEFEALGKPIALRCELADVPPASGHGNELIQVVCNLVFNAVEAMPEGGRLAIRTLAEADSVILEVTDSGIGMDQETRARLFEPFFTTKETGQGLGASIIKGIIERHKGEITVRSAVGKGTTFRVRLPRHKSESPAGEPSPVEIPDPDLTARIVLLDDDRIVRDVYQEALASGGHDVVTVSRGADALAMFEKQKFDLFITDLSMAGMSGFEVAKEARRLDPGMPIIMLSGWTVQHEQDDEAHTEIDFVLDKPCRVEQLLSTVQKAIRIRRAA